MQYAGTLSWSMIGLAGPSERKSWVPESMPESRTRDARQPAVRQAKPRGSALPPRPLSAAHCAYDGAGSGSGNPERGAKHLAGPLAAQGVQFRRREASTLETDWSQVVRRCMDGDSGAWAEMVRAHHKRVYGLCYRFTGNAADAEDLTQDVFLKIYSNLSSFDAMRGSLPVWITTMTRNLLVDNFRRTKNQRATSSLDDGWDQTEDLQPIARLTASGPSPHESAAQKELAKMVQDALARVSPDLREAVILRDLQDMDYKEIACVLGIPEGTVKSRISRGRAELARLLERNKREVM